MSKEKDFIGLIEEALENVRADRDRLLQAYEKMQKALDVSNPEQTITMGITATKILEQLNKANEQIIKLAQIKEKEESRTLKKSDDGPLDIDDIKKFVEATQDKFKN